MPAARTPTSRGTGPLAFALGAALFCGAGCSGTSGPADEPADQGPAPGMTDVRPPFRRLPGPPAGPAAGDVATDTSVRGPNAALPPPPPEKRLVATFFPPGADIAKRRAFVQAAISLLGRPYLFGGPTEQAFDCAGLIYFAGKRAGVPMPGGGIPQFQAGRPIQGADLRPGDIIFLKYPTSMPALKNLPIQHVILYVGEEGGKNGDLLENASTVVSYNSCQNMFRVNCRDLRYGAQYGNFTVYMKDLISGAGTAAAK